MNLLMVAMGYAEVYWGAVCQVCCRELDQAEAKARLIEVCIPALLALLVQSISATRECFP